MRFHLPASAAPALLCVLFVLPAHAEDWAVSVAAGGGKLDRSSRSLSGYSNTTYDDRDTVWAVRAARRFTPHLAAEIHYAHLGNYDFRTHMAGAIFLDGHAEARSAGVALVATWPWRAFDLYARLGVGGAEIRYSNDRSSVGPHETIRRAEAFGGVGAGWMVSPRLRVFGEFQHHAELRVDAWLAGVELRF